MDATAHTPPKDFEVSGYPTLYFIPADTKVPISYSGAREKDAIINFIATSRTTKA